MGHIEFIVLYMDGPADSMDSLYVIRRRADQTDAIETISLRLVVADCYALCEVFQIGKYNR